MSDVKRFCMKAAGSILMPIETYNGTWVLASDYDALATRVAELELELTAPQRGENAA